MEPEGERETKIKTKRTRERETGGGGVWKEIKEPQTSKDLIAQQSPIRKRQRWPSDLDDGAIVPLGVPSANRQTALGCRLARIADVFYYTLLMYNLKEGTQLYRSIYR